MLEDTSDFSNYLRLEKCQSDFLAVSWDPNCSLIVFVDAYKKYDIFRSSLNR